MRSCASVVSQLTDSLQLQHYIMDPGHHDICFDYRTFWSVCSRSSLLLNVRKI